jgi:DNA-binding HxlR family transcriptional regulator
VGVASELSLRRPRRHPAGDVPGRPCSIAAALAVVGERWALLAIREINLGNHRFDQIACNTGAARDILTARLRSLEDAGVIYRRQYQEHPPRYEYHFTEVGKGLRPVLNALRVWGDRWIVEEPPVEVTHSCGRPLDVVSTCVHCGNPVKVGDETDWSERVLVPGWDRHGPTEPSR